MKKPPSVRIDTFRIGLQVWVHECPRTVTGKILQLRELPEDDLHGQLEEADLELILEKGLIFLNGKVVSDSAPRLYLSVKTLEFERYEQRGSALWFKVFRDAKGRKLLLRCLNPEVN